jgi:hypothetical protein
MSKSTIIITGCDERFYDFMRESLDSIFALHLEDQADIGILDLGLSLEQVETLKSKGCIVKTPEWTLPVPEHLRSPLGIGLVARTALRNYFIGYSVYLWFDADAWAQTPEFFAKFVEGAKNKGAAIVRENGVGYRRNWPYNRWWYGHMIAAYGLIGGFHIAKKPAINIGIVALSDTAPHWDAWTAAYSGMIQNRGKINLDQHAFNAALELDHLPGALLPARCNWICTLAPPRWDTTRRLFCEPDGGAHPLSVLHLAGSDKRRVYQLETTTGQPCAAALTYSAMKNRQSP